MERQTKAPGQKRLFFGAVATVVTPGIKLHTIGEIRRGFLKSSLRLNTLFIVLATMFFLAGSGLVAIAQTPPNKIGDRVEAEWRSGRWYTATILDIKAGKYKIRYELDGVIQSVAANKLRPIGGGKSMQAEKPGAASSKKPNMANGLPVIPGTAWKIDWGIKGGNTQVFLFCNTEKWEVVSPMLSSGAVSLMGTYKLKGNNLVTKNSKGKEKTTYRMVWKADVLELDSGKTVMRLHYNGATACK